MSRVMKVMGAAVCVAALCVFWTARVNAWGVVGHRTVARVALSLMTPEAKRAAQAVLGEEDFVASSTWADEIRSKRPETANWHFVDIPTTESNYDPARDCKPAKGGDCIIAELERDQHDIADTSLPIEQRREALKFLIHFVGDLHQPLHCVDNNDRGGNSVRVHLESAPPDKMTNLHSVWDFAVLDSKGMSEQKYGEFIIAGVQAHPPAKERIDYVGWALASHAIAVKALYTYQGFSPGAPPTGVIDIGDAYLKNAQTIVDQQITLAGERLAMILNQVLK